MIRAFFGGIVSFFVVIVLLVVFINHPGIFVGVLVALAFIIGLGIFNGIKASNTPKPQGRGPGNLYAVPDDDEEGDIRHHYDFGGHPKNISDPNTIQNQVFSSNDDDFDDEQHR